MKTVDFGKTTPKFCLRHMVPGYSVEDLQTEDKAAFASALFKRAKMTWDELRVAPRHGLGYELIGGDSLKVAIPTSVVVTEEVRIMAFRFRGKAPMVGYKDGDVFRIIWLDHDFSVYNDHS